jgi:ABC-type sugar transport system ATPase subunit
MDAGAPPLLQVRGISKRFGGHPALRGVDLDLFGAEVHAVAGENGAGKSTLMAILSGALRPDEGELVWEGRAVSPGHVRAAQALGIGMVHQEPQLVPSLSVEENIALGRLPEGLGPLRIVARSALRERAVRALAPLGAAIAPGQRVADLRLADRQLVAIARALGDRGSGGEAARLIILDEPTSSLPAAEVERLFEVLRRLRAQGVALVYISHRLEELRALADRVTVLRDGQVVVTAPMAQVTNDDLVRAMSGRDVAAPGAEAVAAPGEVVLEVAGLTQRGRLHGIDLQVRRGEIVGLAGLMGAGRSRTLRAIFGAAPRDGGEVRVRAAEGAAARPVRTVAEAMAAGMGFVPEDRRHQALVLTASVEENIGLVTPPGSLRRGLLLRRVLRAAAARAVEALRIKTRALDTPVRVLSGGNQQKVVLGRWLGGHVRVLLLDEPTRGVDVGAKAEIHRHLRDLAGHGRGLLVASSELPELLSLCDRICVLRQGRLAGELTRAQASAVEVLRLATGAAAGQGAA